MFLEEAIWERQGGHELYSQSSYPRFCSELAQHISAPSSCLGPGGHCSGPFAAAWSQDTEALSGLAHHCAGSLCPRLFPFLGLSFLIFYVEGWPPLGYAVFSNLAAFIPKWGFLAFLEKTTEVWPYQANVAQSTLWPVAGQGLPGRPFPSWCGPWTSGVGVA